MKTNRQKKQISKKHHQEPRGSRIFNLKELLAGYGYDNNTSTEEVAEYLKKITWE